MTTYLLNAFSAQMIDADTTATFEEVAELPQNLTSAIGHADTANVLGVPCNRINVKLHPGDIAYIAQLQGGRLPEGSTTLPEGFTFKFLKVTINNTPKTKVYRTDYPSQDGSINYHYSTIISMSIEDFFQEAKVGKMFKLGEIKYKITCLHPNENMFYAKHIYRDGKEGWFDEEFTLMEYVPAEITF